MLEEEIYLSGREILAKTTKDIKLLKKLIKDEDACVRVAALDNPKTTITMVNSFMNDENEIVRMILSYHKLLDLKNILKLSKETDPRYKIGLLNNPKTPFELKQQFLEEFISCPEFYEDLTELDYCPTNILEKISTNLNLNYQTRLNLATHPNSTLYVLKMMSYDTSYYVRLKVFLNPNCPVDVKTKILYSFKHIPNKKKENIIKYTNNLDILRFFAKDYSVEARVLVAQNSNTPYYTLDMLAKSKNTLIIKATLSNPNITLETLKYILSQDFKQKDFDLVIQAKNMLKRYGFSELYLKKITGNTFNKSLKKTKSIEIKEPKETSTKIKNLIDKSINDFLINLD